MIDLRTDLRDLTADLEVSPHPPTSPYGRCDPGGLMAENELLTPAEVADMFRVNPKTVTRWARA
ncbi:MAG TPA: hypothetical protein VFS16_06110, partial [Acidimicrobiia bacterium]|nr:hypothetical protein [Acidimicrobiia bacterium]